MVLGNDNNTFNLTPSKMSKQTIICEPCAFFDNFNCYISKESMMNGGSSYNNNGSSKSLLINANIKQNKEEKKTTRLQD